MVEGTCEANSHGVGVTMVWWDVLTNTVCGVLCDGPERTMVVGVVWWCGGWCVGLGDVESGMVLGWMCGRLEGCAGVEMVEMRETVWWTKTGGWCGVA